MLPLTSTAAAELTIEARQCEHLGGPARWHAVVRERLSRHFDRGRRSASRGLAGPRRDRGRRMESSACIPPLGVYLLVSAVIANRSTLARTSSILVGGGNPLSCMARAIRRIAVAFVDTP